MNASILLLLAATPLSAAAASGGGTPRQTSGPAAAPSSAAPSEPSSPAAEAGPTGLPSSSDEDQLAVFVLQRGFYVSSDIGMFTVLGGLNGYSNIQPYLSLKAGIDLGDLISLQLALSQGYVSGNPLSEADAPQGPGQQTASYSLTGVGGELVFAFRPTERVAIEPKLGGGITRMYPQLTDPQNPALSFGSTAPHIMLGVDAKYLTLLTDFTLGAALTTYYVIGPNLFALAGSLVVRYTF